MKFFSCVNTMTCKCCLLLFYLFLLQCFEVGSIERDDEGKLDYFEDNYEANPYETLPPELDPAVTYWPNQLNESRFREDGKVYIYSIEQDPPNVFWIHVYDSRSQLYISSELDIKIVTGIHDDSKNLIPEYTQRITVKIKPGWNKVMVNMHQYKAQIISAGLAGLRTKTKIKALEFKGKT